MDGYLYPANQAATEALDSADLDRMQSTIADHIEAILLALRIEPDHNTEDTPARVARMYVQEIFAGRFSPRPAMTAFPNVSHIDQILTVGPIAFRSCCAHHLAPILGHAWVGVLPGERLIGLSKFHRLTAWVMARPQIQEEATHQLAEELIEAIQPRGLGVVIRARHLCTAWRGVRDEPSMLTTSIMHGAFREHAQARSELMALIAGMGFRA